jgi:hypothetical protein
MRSGGAGRDGDRDRGSEGDGARPPWFTRSSGDGALTTMVSPSGNVLSWAWCPLPLSREVYSLVERAGFRPSYFHRKGPSSAVLPRQLLDHRRGIGE